MHLPELIRDLAVILGVAAIITFLFRRIRQPVVLGYIAAGIVVGPHTPAFFTVSDIASIKVWAELGVIFLMFTLGLEFSFRRLARVGVSASTTASIELVGMMTLGIVGGSLLGRGRMDAVFLGCMIAISSTTIIMKAFEESNLKSKRFAELVFGILIVEDLAAVLMLVALASIATTSEIGGVQLLMAGVKLAIVVGAWFLVGMFLVPRLVSQVGRYGNDEMLTIVATGFCLALVALAAYFHYSAALGAFIMGSILAESREAKRIERLVHPLKDVFGAVFFVSVGMLLDPRVIIDNFGSVVLISAMIIVGKTTFVSLGAFLTGQTIRTSVQTGFSMAQIGEFSFIIGTLGMTYNVVSNELYSMIVAASLITTFTTPYMVGISSVLADRIERQLPSPLRELLNNYATWIQRRGLSRESRTLIYRASVKWALNAVVVIACFTVAADQLVPLVEDYVQSTYVTKGLVWISAFTLSAPSLWAMLSAFRGARISSAQVAIGNGGMLPVSQVLTLGLLGLLSVEYFPAFETLMVTVLACGSVFVVFRRQIEDYYRWLEVQFQSSFQADLASSGGAATHDRLVPWDAHLVEVKVPVKSFVVGKSLGQSLVRERYGLNVVVIVRDGENIVAPAASEVLYPGDRLLCFATDEEAEKFRQDVESSTVGRGVSRELSEYDLHRFKVLAHSPLRGMSLRASGIREKFDCTVVGLERGGLRFKSLKSDTVISEDDVVWVVGDAQRLQQLALAFG